MKKPMILMILDGFGISDEPGNAIKSAHTPYLDRIFSTFSYTQLDASGLAVGLPEGQMGNSEVGHTNIGAGRVVYQELTRITKAIADGDFFENEALLSVMKNAKQPGQALHLMGLLSSGGVHSHNTHLWALLELAKKLEVPRVYVHAILDGRDTSPTSGINFIKECEEKLQAIGIAEIATICGRYFAMDRDNRWDRIKKAYACMVYKEGQVFTNAADAVEKSYQNGITDEFFEPAVNLNSRAISAGDSVVFFNFRPDRARQITRSFVDLSFTGFERKTGCLGLKWVCMTNYDTQMPSVDVAFTPQSLANTFGEYLAKNGKTQLRISETEKYAHVTFFFNGGIEAAYPGETRILVPSPKVATYDLKPEMSAFEVTEKVIEQIQLEKHDVIILNLANCDMVGHTGDYHAAEIAAKVTDECAERIIDAISQKQGVAIITADHGNADKMFNSNNDLFTAHSCNPVPFCIVGYPCELRAGGKLADISPTMLRILGLDKPPEMTGQSLIK